MVSMIQKEHWRAPTSLAELFKEQWVPLPVLLVMILVICEKKLRILRTLYNTMHLVPSKVRQESVIK